MQLLGEQIDAQVAVLAGGGGARDANHLARVALQHQNVADADVVAGDCDCVREKAFGCISCCCCGCISWVSAFAHFNHLPVRRATIDGVDDAARHLVESVAEGVIMA